MIQMVSQVSLLIHEIYYFNVATLRCFIHEPSIINLKGVGWSIMGIHDMGWKERAIFGKIRFMNYDGCKRKFKVDSFVAKYRNAKPNAIKAEAKLGKGPSKVSKKRKTPST